MDFEKYDYNDVKRFKEDLFVELGIENNPKRDKLFSLAWEMGHSCGFNEVYLVVKDLVELIREDK